MKIAAMSKSDAFLKKLEAKYNKSVLSLGENASEVLNGNKDITHVFFDIEECEEVYSIMSSYLYYNPISTVFGVCAYYDYKDHYKNLPFHDFVKV